MKNRLLQLAGGLALIAVLGKFYGVPLMAQVHAALIKNIDEPARAPYQHDAQCGSFSGNCSVLFAAVPAHKRLVVETVSAQIQALPASAHILDSYLGDGTIIGQGARLYLTPILTAIFPDNFSAIFSFTAKADCFFESGTTPQLIVMTADATQVTVSAAVTGYLIDLTE